MPFITRCVPPAMDDGRWTMADEPTEQSAEDSSHRFCTGPVPRMYIDRRGLDVLYGVPAGTRAKHGLDVQYIRST